MLRPLRPKPCILRPLRLIVGMLRLCATKTFARLCATQNKCCDFARLKLGMLRPLRLRVDTLRLCATKIFARLCATQNRCDFARPKRDMLRFCATQNRCVATSRVEVCDLCFDRLDQKMVSFNRLDPFSVCFDRLDPSCICFDYVRKKNNSTVFDRGKTLRPSLTEEFF